jgi:hypothetical protein
MISSRTLELIEEFRKARWFENVGTPLGYETVVPVYSWEQAIEVALSDEWENTCLEAQNGLTMRLDQDFLDRYMDWNHHIDAINEVLLPIVDPVAIRTIEEHADIEKFHTRFKIMLEPGDPTPADHDSYLFRQVLLSTTRMACMEAEYSDIVPLAFFSEMSAWYLAGHFPCGLTDEYPNGKLMVF